MAKKKATKKSGDSTINKTALIKEALSQNSDASPKEVAESVGHGVTPKYVSTIKTNMRTATTKPAKKKRGRPKGSTNKVKLASRATNTNGANTNESLGPVIAFIEAAGSLRAAKRQLETIERIKQL